MNEIRVLEKKSDVLEAIKLFKDVIRKSSKKLGIRRMDFPGGGSAKEVEVYGCQTSHGQLVVGFPNENWGNRVPIFLNLNPPSNSKYSPNVEVNIPFKHDRKISGCFVYDEARNTHVMASRGKLTSYKSAISKDIVFGYFEDWLFVATDKERESNLISVGALNSPRLTEDLAEYTAAVNQLKEKIKSGDTGSLKKSKISTSKANGIGWHDGKEFEGRVKIKKGSSESIYDYSHGPIKNACVDYLKNKFSKQFDVRSSVHVDIALVDRSEKARAIFEVKTSTHFGSQIYQAIGQLQVYTISFGTENCQKILILPEKLSRDQLSIITALGIEVCLFADGKLLCDNGEGGEYVFN